MLPKGGRTYGNREEAEGGAEPDGADPGAGGGAPVRIPPDHLQLGKRCVIHLRIHADNLHLQILMTNAI